MKIKVRKQAQLGASPTSLPKISETSFLPYRFHAPGRVVAIGDLHGDAIAMRRALKLAKAIDKDDRWIGKDLVVVQVGDQIDRWHQDREVLDFMDHLDNEAQASGGRVISILGNHEIFNVKGILSFVTPESFFEFSNISVPAHHPEPTGLWLSRPGMWGLPGVTVHLDDPGVKNRAYAFEPGGVYAKKLSTRPLFAIVNDSVFVHGGITLKDLRQDLPRQSSEIQKWMFKGSLGSDPPEIPHFVESRRLSDKVLSQSVCDDLKDVLTVLGVKRMIVGHTIQTQGMNSACDGRVWRIDVMLSKAFQNWHRNDYHYEVLEISEDPNSPHSEKVKILR